MWQEFIVVLLVIASIVYIALRVRTAFKRTRGVAEPCAGDCPGCGRIDAVSLSKK